MSFQELYNEMSKGYRAQRSLSQLTLRGLIFILEKYPLDKKIKGIHGPHSYRGYYSDLAFYPDEKPKTVEEQLRVLKEECLEKTFIGYKGGEFFMDKHTPLWLAEFGDLGLKIMEIRDGEVLELVTAADED